MSMSSPPCAASDEENLVLIVKNTFISLQRDCAHRKRCMSVPASWRFRLEPPTEEGTDCQKDTPLGYSDAATAFGGEDVATSSTGSDDKAGSAVDLYENREDHLNVSVKNTFITLQRGRDHRSRRMSVPASIHLFSETLTEEGAQCQKDTPLGYSSAERAFGGEDVAMSAIGSDDTAGSAVVLYENRDDHLDIFPTLSKDTNSSSEPPARSNAQARQWDWSMRYKRDYARVIKRAMKVLQESEFVSHVHKSENSQVCSLILQMSANRCSQKERVLTFVQNALLEAAGPSKSIYVVGYCSPDAFTSSETGFEATFAAMEDAATACWHLFKKGICRHGSACCKRHPVWTMPTRVFVAGESLAPPKSIGMTATKLEH